MKNIRFSIVKYLAVWACILTSSAYAGYPESITVNVARIPVLAETAEKGVLVDLLKAISRETNTPITISVLPISRSIQQVQRGEVDLHIPAIIPDSTVNQDDFYFTEAVIFNDNFVLYTNINNDISIADLGDTKLDIRSIGPAVKLYGFPTTPTASAESAFRMLNRQRIDGFILSDTVGDVVLSEMKLSTIKRQLYKVYSIGGILQQEKRNGRADKILQKGIKILKQKGFYAENLPMLGLPYNDWQPYKGETRP